MEVRVPARLCIVRHGETDWNRSGIVQGWIDVPINDHGRHQAHQVAQSLIGRGIDRIYSSPLRRAYETAELIARQLQLPPPAICEGLKERHFGDAQGCSKDDLAHNRPTLLNDIVNRNPAATFTGGEEMLPFAYRVLTSIREIGSRHPGQCILIITHGWVIDAITRDIRGLTHDTILDMKPKNGEMLWLEVIADSIHAAA